MENLILTDQSQAFFSLGVVALIFLLFLRKASQRRSLRFLALLFCSSAGCSPMEWRLRFCSILLLGPLRPCFWLWRQLCVLAALTDVSNWRIA